MPTGIYAWFGFSLPIQESFKLIASAGFDNVSFWWGDQFQNNYDAPRQSLPELARKTGLWVENVHADYELVNYLWRDCLESEEIVEKYLSDIDDCNKHQIPAIVLHLTSGPNPPMPSEFGLDRFKRLADRAEQKNISIALENTRSIQHLAFIYERINSEKLKFCYDSGHEHCFTKTNDLLDMFGSRLVALHLHDNDGSDDQHRFPGEGTIHWQDVISKLKQNRFNGSITLEAAKDTTAKAYNASPEAFLSEAHQRAKDLCWQ